MAATMLTAGQVAEELGIDAKALRKFLRSDAQDVVEPVGQGNRYAIPRQQVRKLAKAYDAWTEARSRSTAESE